jgi:hypothetical protein
MGKVGQPPKPKQAKHEKACQIFYEDYKSAGYAAKALKLHRHTVEKYYRKFQSQELAETNESFIASQRATKNRVIEKLDDMISRAEAQLERCEGMTGSDGDESTAGQNYERIAQKSITDISNLYQQKADIEMTPTLDIHLAAEIEKRYAELSTKTK